MLSVRTRRAKAEEESKAEPTDGEKPAADGAVAAARTRACPPIPMRWATAVLNLFLTASCASFCCMQLPLPQWRPWRITSPSRSRARPLPLRLLSDGLVTRPDLILEYNRPFRMVA